MRYFNKIKGILGILVLVCVCACSGDYEEDVDSFDKMFISTSNVDKNTNGNLYNAWGFVRVSGTDFYIKTDTKKILKLKDFNNSSIGAEQGDRIFMTFSIPQNQAKVVSTTYDYVVVAKSLFVVDYEGITVIKERENEKMLNGFVKVEGIDISADNLNLKIIYNKSSKKKHAIKLCYDENIQKKNKPLLLELKDTSAESQKSTRKVTKLQSYNIRQLEQFRAKDEEGKIEFVVVTNRGKANQEHFNMVYNP